MLLCTCMHGLEYVLANERLIQELLFDVYCYRRRNELKKGALSGFD